MRRETRNTALWLMIVLLNGTVAVSAQDLLAPVAGEYRISGQIGGNQVFPDLAFNAAGGYVVWQDDALDGMGTAIGAQRLNSNLSGAFSPVQVNAVAAGNQEKPRIAMSDDGGGAIVWQSGVPGHKDVYLRVLRPDGTFAGPEVRVNQYTRDFQIEPGVTVLANGSIVVVWDSFDQDGHLRAVMARRYDKDGNALGDEFQVNQSTHLNQRHPAIEALAGGGFVVAWISERLLGSDAFGGAQFAADIMVRRYTATGAPETDELRVNAVDEICAFPAVSAGGSGDFIVVWAQSSTINRESGWNIWAAGYSAAGQKIAGESRINDHEHGDQYAPRIARRGAAIFTVWSSLGQDGSFEGVYGRALGSAGQPFGDEIRVNTLTFNRQLNPTLAVDVDGRFLAVWSDYSNGGSGFNLHGQRLASAAPLPVLPAPFATALSGTRLFVSWPALAGYDLAHYEVHVDDAAPLVASNQSLTISGLIPGSNHEIRLGYRLRDGRAGELSPPVTVSSWSEDENFDGLPDDWQRSHWGESSSNWPSTLADSDNDGASNLAEFLAGTSPVDATDVLTMAIENRGGSIWISWNTRPGLIYEVQQSTDTKEWARFGDARFAADRGDQLHVSGDAAGIFRVVRIR